MSDAAMVVGLVELVHRCVAEPGVWARLERQFGLTLRSLPDVSARALDALRSGIEEIIGKRVVVRTPGARFRHVPPIEGDVYERLASLLPRESTREGRTQTAALEDSLRALLAPAVEVAMQERLLFLQSSFAEAQLESCVEHCAQGVMTFDEEGSILFINQSACRLLGLSASASTTLRDLRILPRRIRTAVTSLLRGLPASRHCLPSFSLEVGGTSAQCFSFVAQAEPRAGMRLLHMFLIAEPGLDALTDRLKHRANLSPQEARVARAMIEGKSNGIIASDMKLSMHTVRTYVERVYEKLEVQNRHELMRLLTSLSVSPLADERKP